MSGRAAPPLWSHPPAECPANRFRERCFGVL
jgi:hypothetical protein